jgi:integrase
MATIHRLEPRFVATVKAKGMYADGGGLYLQVSEGGGAKSWIFRYYVEGRGDRQMGLGPAHTIGLAEARELARLCRMQRLNGIDPIDARNAERLAQRLKAAKDVTFEVCINEWMKLKSKEWQPNSERYARRVCKLHVIPKLGKLPVSAINVDLVESAIKPIWGTTQRTGRDAVGYMQEILDFAKAKDYRQGDNPADLKGPLGLRLGKYLHKPKPYDWLPVREIGAFMARMKAAPLTGERPSPTAYTVPEAAMKVGVHGSAIRQAIRKGRIIATTIKTGDHFIEPSELHKMYPPKNDEDPRRRSVVSCALEFAILTAVRSHQVLGGRYTPGGLRWNEIDWNKKFWRCPPERTKQKKLHEIPLSAPAMAILETMRALQKAYDLESEFVFVQNYGRGYGKVPHPLTMNAYLVHRLGRPDLTVHGFRKTFSTWAHEDGRFAHNDIELALGHAPEGNQVSHIYNQAKRLEPRRLLMEAWAEYCDRTEPLPAEVVPFRQQTK